MLNKTTFGGSTVDASCILIKFTYGGDCEPGRTGRCDRPGRPGHQLANQRPWTGGDFNYDGFVDVSDLGILATDWQLGVGSPLGRGRFEAALASVGLGGISVPEPLSASVFAPGALVAVRRRRQNYSTTDERR